MLVEVGPYIYRETREKWNISGEDGSEHIR